ncbi:MAG: hypothetical protein ACLTSG_00020 [Lachnospiraceae bacterium]
MNPQVWVAPQATSPAANPLIDCEACLRSPLRPTSSSSDWLLRRNSSSRGANVEAVTNDEMVVAFIP